MTEQIMAKGERSGGLAAVRASWQRSGWRPVRNVDSGSLLENFLIYAVAAILGIRLYLEATGYPQVGGGGLHIAHMLWGGVLMVIAIVFLLAFLGKTIVRLSAVLAGLGFGIFIDELGKFITSDNDYFYQPTFAVMYVIFIVLFLWFRAIDRRRTLSPQEALVNALDYIKEAVRHDLDMTEKEQALALLRQSDQADATVQALERMLDTAEPLPDPRPNPLQRLGRWAHAQYRRVVGRRWFPGALDALFVVIGLLDLAGLIATLTDEDLPPDLSVVQWGDLLSSAAVCALILIGIVSLRRSRLGAYRWFRRAVLVSIFLSQVFSFYSQQLAAVIGVAIDLVLLAALNYVIHEEHETLGDEAAVPAGVGT